jgi:hypothetical protein
MPVVGAANMAREGHVEAIGLAGVEDDGPRVGRRAGHRRRRPEAICRCREKDRRIYRWVPLGVPALVEEPGVLTSITDSSDLVTTVERADAGLATAIVAPNGRRTALTIGAECYLAAVDEPGSIHHE